MSAMIFSIMVTFIGILGEIEITWRTKTKQILIDEYE